MAQYNIIAENDDYTIVSDYEAVYRTNDKHQSEAQLEKELIKPLRSRDTNTSISTRSKTLWRTSVCSCSD